MKNKSFVFGFIISITILLLFIVIGFPWWFYAHLFVFVTLVFFSMLFINKLSYLQTLLAQQNKILEEQNKIIEKVVSINQNSDNGN